LATPLSHLVSPRSHSSPAHATANSEQHTIKHSLGDGLQRRTLLNDSVVDEPDTSFISLTLQAFLAERELGWPNSSEDLANAE